MNLILLDNVENLGSIGDMVTVKPGYGRNFLLPQGKAALATKANMKELEARRAELEKAAAAELAAAKKRAKDISSVEIVIPANVGSEGKLFGSIGPIDIADAFEAIQVDVQRSEVRLPDGPLHEAGEFQVGIHLHPEVDTEVTVRIVPSE